MNRINKMTACALLTACLPLAYAAEKRSYSEDLATLYNEHQRVIAMRDACVIAQPEARGDLEGAYKDWRTRHAHLLEELELRFAGIIKRASKDQAEYSKHYGKYQSEVVAMREDTKKNLLSRDKEKFGAECREFVGYLKESRSDLPMQFPAEYRNVRSAR